jgi:tetratricopeptide (TPR) repeat protein
MAEASLFRLFTLIDPEKGYLELADFYLENDKPESALKILQIACKNDPKNYDTYIAKMVDTYHMIGVFYDNMNQYDKAIESYRRAALFEPNEPFRWNSLGDGNASAGYFENAIKYYKKSAELDPDRTWTHILLAWTYHFDLHNYKKAAEEWEEVIAREPNVTTGFYLFLGYSYEKSGNMQEAEKTFKKAAEIKPPGYTDYYFKKGNIEYAHGNYEAAIDCYDIVLRLEPDRIDVHYGLGKTYHKSGNKELAMHQYEILKSMDEKMAEDLLEFINDN